MGLEINLLEEILPKAINNENKKPTGKEIDNKSNVSSKALRINLKFEKISELFMYVKISENTYTYPLFELFSKILKNFEEKVVKNKYKHAAVTKNVKGECSTLELILVCRIISTKPVTEINEVSFKVICQTFPNPGIACLIICGASIL